MVIADLMFMHEKHQLDMVEIEELCRDIRQRLTAQEADRTIWNAQLVCPVCGFGQEAEGEE